MSKKQCTLSRSEKNRFIWWLGKKIGFPWLYWSVRIKGYRFDIPSRESYAKKIMEE